MNDSVDSDALVMPSNSGCAVAGRRPSASTRSFSLEEAELVDLLVDEELGVTDVLDAHPAQHLPHHHFDVLVVDVHALQTVDLLHLVDEVLLQLLLAEHVEDVVRIARTIHQRIARAHALAVLHVDVHTARNRVLPRVTAAFVGHDQDLALPLDDAAVLDGAIDLADHRRISRLAGLEQLDHARQTARDVLGLGGLARDLRDHVTRLHLFAVLHHHVGVHRHDVARGRPCRRRRALRPPAASSRRPSR